MTSEIVLASFQAFCFQGNTFFFFCCSISSSECCSVVSDSLHPHGLYSPLNSPGKNTGVGCHALLHGIFPTQGLKPGHPQWQWILYCLNHQGNPRTLEWVAYPFSRGSSQPRNQTGVSCIAGGFFTSWATREAISSKTLLFKNWCGGCLFFFASLSFSRARSLQTWHCNQEGVEDSWPFTDVDPSCQSICSVQFHSWVFLTVLYQPQVGSSPGTTARFSDCRMKCGLYFPLSQIWYPRDLRLPLHTWCPEHFLSSLSTELLWKLQMLQDASPSQHPVVLPPWDSFFPMCVRKKQKEEERPTGLGRGGSAGFGASWP